MQRSDPSRLAPVLAALSLATYLGGGFGDEAALRTAMLFDLGRVAQPNGLWDAPLRARRARARAAALALKAHHQRLYPEMADWVAQPLCASEWAAAATRLEMRDQRA